MLKSGLIAVYLRYLRERNTPPVSAQAIEELGVLPGFKSAENFLEELDAALATMSDEEQALCRGHLFGKNKAEERAKAFASQSGRPGSYYRNHIGKALEALAAQLSARLEEQTAIESERFGDSGWWYRQVGTSYSLRLDPDDYRRQYWEIEVEVECERRDQPVVFHREGWTGRGEREELEVLSGQNRPPEARHQWLRVRPEDDRAFAWQCHVFDLGRLLLPGRRETLHFRHTLFDRESAFQPFIALSTLRNPWLERLRISIDFGGHDVSEVLEYREVLHAGSTTGYVPIEPFTPIEVGDGKVAREWLNPTFRGRYAISWMPKYLRYER